jgi:hypothetical protein
MVACASHLGLVLWLLRIRVFGDVGEEEVGMAVEEIVGVLEIGLALVVGGLVGSRLGTGGSRARERVAASSHLADHVLGGAQGHVEGDVGRMVEVGGLAHYLLDALGRVHVECRGLGVDSVGR